MKAPTRPVIRYHGGKWRIYAWIASHFPPHEVYVEPFGGAGSVLMRKEPSAVEVYNDLDDELVTVFRVLRDPTSALELERRLRRTPFARREFEHAYAPAPDDPIERTRRAIVRAYMGFGSASFTAKHATGFRTYSKRLDRLPCKDWANYPDQIGAYVARLAGVIIENRPAAAVIEAHDRTEALHYVDPPYPLATRGCARGVRQKYPHDMSDDQHRELAAVLRAVKGAVVLSGYPCDLYDVELYADWHRVERKVFADGARRRTEVLWLNAKAAGTVIGE